jgi:hypothetical protein
MNAFLVSHNGLGDNLYMIGALRYLSQFYNTVYIVCKIKNYENFKLFFTDTQNIICVPIDEREEQKHMINFLRYGSQKQENDLFVCGSWKHLINSRISNKNLIQSLLLEKSNQNLSEYKIDYDMLTSNNYSFIENFYKDIGMNLSIFYNYYKIPETEQSIELYKKIQEYNNIIFIQLKSSCGKSLDVSNLITKYIHDENAILICNDVNLYTEYLIKNNNLNQDKLENILHKQELCNNFKYNKIVHYYHTIINSNEIYIIDSCFIGIVLPLLKQNKLKANTVRIILRDSASQIKL